MNCADPANDSVISTIRLLNKNVILLKIVKIIIKTI